jgi:hypothetical protein
MSALPSTSTKNWTAATINFLIGSNSVVVLAIHENFFDIDYHDDNAIPSVYNQKQD